MQKNGTKHRLLSGMTNIQLALISISISVALLFAIQKWSQFAIRSEVMSEARMIQSLKTSLSTYSMTSVISGKSEQFPINPFLALNTLPPKYISWEDHDPDKPDSWHFLQEYSCIVHIRRDGTRLVWNYNHSTGGIVFSEREQALKN